MNMVQWEFPYKSQRMPVMAENIVATSQPLASQAGIEMFKKGGNAVDAAIAAAICLTVVEPTSNGIGSDAFAILWDGKKIQGVNGSGCSPKLWKREYFEKYSEMPLRGWDSVTIPGAVDMWKQLSYKYGKLPFCDLFTSAINYARNGFPLSPIIAYHWNRAKQLYKDFDAFQKMFFPDNFTAEAGSIFSSKDLADTLQEIAETDGKSFYSGRLAEKIAEVSFREGGSLRYEDLAEHKTSFVETITVDYNNYTVHELPPNGQGLVALIALGILEKLQLEKYEIDTPVSYHLQIEAIKLGFAEAFSFLADPKTMNVNPVEFLKDEYFDRRSEEINLNKAQIFAQSDFKSHGTVYLTAADKNGMMISFIQSNFYGFGSGIVIPETGISMQNRGYGFTLKKNHPNEVGPQKKPFQTIIPAFVTEKNNPVLSFGVMGGHMQPQGHVQMIHRILDKHQNPQAASDAPRWLVKEDNSIALEEGTDYKITKELKNKGHIIAENFPTYIFGGMQGIYKIKQCYCGASDHRKDGIAAGF